MPDMLKHQIETTLKENLTRSMDASVVQPLQRALLTCKEEAVASFETIAGEMSQQGQHRNNTIYNTQRLFNGQRLESLSRLQQTLEAVSLKIDKTNSSNQ